MACPDGLVRCPAPGTGRKSPIAGSRPRRGRHGPLSRRDSGPCPLSRRDAARCPGSSREPVPEINRRVFFRHYMLEKLPLIVTNARDVSW
jgi:hypothetical protein